MTYAVIYAKTRTGYSAHVPDLPGCIAAGGTLAETKRLMREAIALGRAGMRESGGGPFGAVVVSGGEIVGHGCNQVTRLLDPTAHAEVTAIRDACRALQRFDLDRGVGVTAMIAVRLQGLNEILLPKPGVRPTRKNHPHLFRFGFLTAIKELLPHRAHHRLAALLHLDADLDGAGLFIAVQMAGFGSGMFVALALQHLRQAV